MKTSMQSSNFISKLFLLCLLIGLVSCSNRLNDLADLSKPLPTHIRFEQVLRDAKKAYGVKAMNLQILAADLAIVQKYPARAQDILDDLNRKILPNDQRIYANVVAADLAVKRRQPQLAISLLSQQIMTGIVLLPRNYQARLHLVKAKALEDSGQTIAAIKERIFVNSLLNDQQRINNNTQVWYLLRSLPELKLRKTGDYEFDAWQELSRSFGRAETVRQQQVILNKWLQKYPNHPGANILPIPLAKLPVFANIKLNRIALVLPKDGKSAAIAANIKHGFMAAHLAAEEQGADPVEILEFDARQLDDTSVKDFYRNLEAQGVNVVVGPLDKNHVNKVARYNNYKDKITLPIATIALNYAEDLDLLARKRVPWNMFQFGLAVEDEIREVVLKARADGHKRAIALVPNTAWGNKVLKEFRKQWREDGGLMLTAEKFDRPADLSAQIEYLLRIKQSAKRGAKLAKVLGKNSFEFKPTRRQDVDFIFMVATPKQAQQIKPILNYHYAKDLPVYATSQIYNNDLTINQYEDLNDILFCDAPWLLKTATPLRLKVDPYWQDATGTVGRLYAMGADAYHLAISAEQLEESQEASFEGLSGYLFMEKDGRINRRLTWAQFTGFQIRLLEEAAY